MTFALCWNKQPEKFIDNLPVLEAERILKKFDEIKQDPFRYAKSYQGHCFKIRVGNYRALIDVDTAQNCIEIQYIEKRENAY